MKLDASVLFFDNQNDLRSIYCEPVMTYVFETWTGTPKYEIKSNAFKEVWNAVCSALRGEIGNGITQ